MNSNLLFLSFNKIFLYFHFNISSDICVDSTINMLGIGHIASPLGGRCRGNWQFSVGEIPSHGSNFLASPLGGDVEKIGDCQEGEIHSHGIIFWHHLLGSILRKLANEQSALLRYADH